MEAITDRMIMPLKILLALLLAWVLADGVWFFLGGAETDVSVAADDAPIAARRGQPVASAGDIAAMNLFGRADSTEVAALDAPETRLQLELQGVFLGNADGTSSAIVAERNRDGRLFFIGDRMPGNAELLRVLEDRIVLRRSGTLETLRFPEADAARGFSTEGGSSSGDVEAAGGSTGLSNRGGSDPATASDGRPRTSRDATSPMARNDRTDEGSGSDLRDLVSDYRQRLQTDPDSTLRDLGVEAVQLGESQGYRVGSEASSADLARIGLRAGDVVLTVNGRQVSELQQDSAAVDGILDSGTARLEIQRGERRFFVTTRIPRQ